MYIFHSLVENGNGAEVHRDAAHFNIIVS